MMFSFGGRSLRVLAAAAILVLCGSGVMAQEKFTLPQPDLSVVNACVGENTNDVASAAQCYSSLDTLCFDNWFLHYSTCLPQEVSYWSKTLNNELQRSQAAEAAVEARKTINANMAVQCTEPKARYRQICEARYLRDNAVLLHMRRIWAEAAPTN